MQPTIVADRLYGISLRPHELALHGERVSFSVRYGTIGDDIPATTHFRLLVLEIHATVELEDGAPPQRLELLRCGWELELATPAPCRSGGRAAGGGPAPAGSHRRHGQRPRSPRRPGGTPGSGLGGPPHGAVPAGMTHEGRRRRIGQHHLPEGDAPSKPGVEGAMRPQGRKPREKCTAGAPGTLSATLWLLPSRPDQIRPPTTPRFRLCGGDDGWRRGLSIRGMVQARTAQVLVRP